MSRSGAGERAAAVGLVAMALAGGPEIALGRDGYKKPPKEVLDILHAPPPPTISLNPARDTLLLVETARYPSIADLAQPTLRLAGVRINPRTNGPDRSVHVTGLTLLTVEGSRRQPVELPPGKVGAPEWSPDGKRFAVTVTGDRQIELWVGEVESAKLTKVPGIVLNAAYGDPVRWLPDSNSLIGLTIPASRGLPPEAPPAPIGPVVQEAGGQAAPVRTFQDLLKNAHDEDLFDYHATSQPVVVEVDKEGITPLGKPAVYAGLSPSPDGKYLLVTRVKRPYSYLHPVSAFPRTVEVWDRAGNVVRTVADLPLQDKVPIEGVPTGPRNVGWVSTADSTLYWAEARDDGNPKKKVPYRDQVIITPLNDGAQEVPPSAILTEHRFAGLSFLPDGHRALLSTYDRDRRWARTFLHNLADKAAEPVRVFDRSIQDRYNDPGTPLTRRLPSGRLAVWEVDGKLFLAGTGATPKGNRPFLDRFDLATGKKERLFQCGEGVHETATPLTDDASKLLVRRESPTSPPNYYLRVGGNEAALTTFTDPAPQLRQVKRQLVTTKRPDGVTISFTLLIPPDYKEGEKRPTVFYAYPREFNTADTAGQVSGSPHEFLSVLGPSHLFFLTQGYAIMDGVSIPIVGDPEKANDTYIDQLVSSAKAAIDKAAELGPVDPERIGVTGHSYGAFMTANLLAHSDLFRAGIARSGAYNRTLTPFGFQNERRTFWEAPGVYAGMSPFNHAHKVNEPLLLIHGAADNNPGTFPVQSERMYQAVRGNGGTVRLVMLPHESHGYAARESIEHVLHEQIAWFDRHVKAAKPRSQAGEDR